MRKTVMITGVAAAAVLALSGCEQPESGSAFAEPNTGSGEQFEPLQLDIDNTGDGSGTKQERFVPTPPDPSLNIGEPSGSGSYYHECAGGAVTNYWPDTEDSWQVAVKGCQSFP